MVRLDINIWRVNHQSFQGHNDENSTATIIENDPSIIICRNSSNQGKKIMYSLNELLALRNEPVSKMRPSNLNDACRNIFRSNDNNIGVAAASGLNQHSTQQLSSIANGNNDRDRDGVNKPHQRRSNDLRDPRERLRKEDGIVLSPQRRSFTMGCQMPQIAQSSTTSLSTSSQSNSILRSNERENLLNVRDRRIGSGRIIARDVSWDYRPDKETLDNQDYSGGLNYRNGGTGGGNNTGLIGYRERDRDRDERYDRRSFGRGNDYDYDKDNGRQSERSNNRNVLRFTSSGGNDNSNDNRHYNNNNNNNNHNHHHHSSHQQQPQHHQHNSHHRSNNRNSHHNDYNNMKDDEPEWFSGGPTSQLDTIELRGFDDHHHNDGKTAEGSKKDDKLNNNTITNNTKNNSNNRRLSLDDMIKVNRNKNKKSDNSNVRDGVKATNDDSIDTEEKLTEASTPPPARSTPAKKKISNLTEKNKNNRNNNNDDDGKNLDNVKVNPIATNNDDEVKSDGADFNFEDFLKLDSLSGLLNNEGSVTKDESRFSQWFKRESPKSFHKMMGQQSPIPQQDNINNETSANTLTTNKLLEILQRKNNMAEDNIDYNSCVSVTGKVHSVEELEARLRNDGNKQNINSMSQQQGRKSPSIMSGGQSQQFQQQSQNKDMAAFNKFLAQITADKQMNQQQNEDMTKMFPGMFIQQQPSVQRQQRPRQIIGQQQPAAYDMIQKLIHIQQEHQLQSTDNMYGEILKRPDAQMLLQSLTRGESTQPQIWQQLNNPNLPTRHGDMLKAIPSTFNASPRVGSPNILLGPQIVHGVAVPQQGSGVVPSQVVQPGMVIPIVSSLPVAHGQNQRTGTSPIITSVGGNSGPDIQPHLLFHPQQMQNKQMRLSPLPNGVAQRIPSPRELQFHTQSIMQNALIRKKLEEQTENYRKRQEQQQSGSIVSSATSGISSLVSSQSSGTASSTQVNTGAGSTVSHSVSPVRQHQQHIASPTPTLAFTPTSVLRKMTAGVDKDSVMDANQNGGSGSNNNISNNFNNNNNNNQNLKMQMQSQQQHQQMRGFHQTLTNKWNPFNQVQNLPSHQQAQSSSKPQGRPILKGSIQTNFQMQQIQMANNVDYMQHCQNKQLPLQQPFYHSDNTEDSQQDLNQMNQLQFMTQKKQQIQRGGVFPQQQFGYQSDQQEAQQQQDKNNQLLKFQNLLQKLEQKKLFQQMQQQQQTQQQLRAMFSQQMQMQIPPTGLHDGSNTANFMQQQQQQQQQPQKQQQTQQPSNQPNDGMMGFGRDGNLSPTSNQLARWFSPELLEKASAGQLPSIDLTQALSLEEYERIQQSSATVHN